MISLDLFRGVNRRYALEAVGIGIFFMFLALIVQEMIEGIPDVIFLIRVHFDLSAMIADLSSIEIRYPILYSLYIGCAAGFIQEGFTYVSVDTRTRRMAFFIGLGFSVVDIVVLILSFLLPALEIHNIYGISAAQGALISLNIISSLLFHPGTATFMKWGQIQKMGRLTYLISSVLHAGIDGGLVYTDIFIILHRGLYLYTTVIFWSLTIVISVAIFLVGLSKLASTKDEDEFRKEIPVVF
ncbi:hypothetical protein [Thermoplasma sp. Kam2015]|uniref:hypothetical protein n=1 Tax=Thermoplasma sp. Kam2015 TaxID=2094122 RepID=UPI0012934A18|nr:hypothetical protein [Thermoplasma sp. Kam2015]